MEGIRYDFHLFSLRNQVDGHDINEIKKMEDNLFFVGRWVGGDVEEWYEL